MHVINYNSTVPPDSENKSQPVVTNHIKSVLNNLLTAYPLSQTQWYRSWRT